MEYFQFRIENVGMGISVNAFFLLGESFVNGWFVFKVDFMDWVDFKTKKKIDDGDFLWLSF